MRWFLLCVALAATPAAAEDLDFDLLQQIDDAVLRAQEAAEAGDWLVARKNAEQALALDDSYVTAPARVVLIRALIQEGAYDSASYELRHYRELPLKDDDLATADRLERDIARLQRGGAGASKVGAPSASARAGGIGLLLGGAAPVVVGGWLVGNDIRHASQGTESGTWAVIGGTSLAVGVGLEIAGAVALTRGKTVAVLPTFSADDGLVLGVAGRF